VTAIDGQPIDEVMLKLAQLRGGTPQWRRLHASQYLALQDLLYGIDVAGYAALELDSADSSRDNDHAKAEAFEPPASEAEVFVERWLSTSR